MKPPPSINIYIYIYNIIYIHIYVIITSLEDTKMIQVYHPPVRDESLAGSASFKSLFKIQNCWEGVEPTKNTRKTGTSIVALWLYGVFFQEQVLIVVIGASTVICLRGLR